LTPVIFLAEAIEEEEIAQGFEAGAADYVAKPFSPAILLARVKTQLRLALHEKHLREQANLDFLSLLPNRRRLESVLDAEWRRALRNGQPLGLIMADIDRLKQYNDVLGHLAGDDVIRAVSRVLDDSGRREGDFVARYGEEEFAIVLPEMNLQEVVEFAEKLRLNVLREEISHPASTIGPYISISLGAASRIPQAELTPADLIADAGQQLLLAKRQGRNRVYPMQETPSLPLAALQPIP
jgi:diguanylate cyclase (GGDEF)-like protein